MKAACPICAAARPREYTTRQWWIIIKAVWREIGEDNVSIVAAGVAFFTMLAIFPLITACLSIYGMFADPVEVQNQFGIMARVLPPEAFAILSNQVQSVAAAPLTGLKIGVALGLLIALWSAGAGIRAIMRAMNIAYGETEKRGFAQFYALAASLTLSVTLFLWLALAVIIGVPALLSFINLDGLNLYVAKIMPWFLIVSLFAFSTTVLYRIGPSRRAAKFRWVMPGVIFATLSWVIISVIFSKYVADFGTYNKTYGGLSAAIILLVWFWLTTFVVIVGAELNAELERHTSVDTTRGKDRPIGERGAAMADYSYQI